jgi:hypothetical protein
MDNSFAKALEGLPQVIEVLPVAAPRVKITASPPPFAVPV